MKQDVQIQSFRIYDLQYLICNDKGYFFPLIHNLCDI